MEMKHFDSPGQVMTELRAYRCAIGTVDPTAYHAWKDQLDYPCVSKSSLLDFTANPFVYRYNKEHGVRKESSALKKGSLIDCLTLTPELFTEQFAVGKVDKRTKEGKALAADIEARGLTLISDEEYAAGTMAAKHAVAVLAELCGAPGEGYLTQVGMWVLLDSINGVELETPIIVSGMLDVLPTGEGMPLIDLKSTSVDVADAGKLNRNFSDFGYGVQAAMYADMFQVCMSEPWSRGFLFLFVGSDAPSQTRLVRINDGDMEFYRSRYCLALQNYAHCCATGDWGELHLPEMMYSMPAWEARKGVEV